MVGFKQYDTGGGGTTTSENRTDTLVAGVPKELSIPTQSNTNYCVYYSCFDDDGDPVVVKIDPALQGLSSFWAITDWDAIITYKVEPLV